MIILRDMTERPTNLVDHVTFRMPALVAVVPVDLDELLEDRTRAAGALGREAGGIMVVAINVTLVLVIRVLRPEERVAERTRKMFDVELFILAGMSTERNMTR
jgi:hypothetical protein